LAAAGFERQRRRSGRGIILPDQADARSQQGHAGCGAEAECAAAAAQGARVLCRALLQHHDAGLALTTALTTALTILISSTAALTTTGFLTPLTFLTHTAAIASTALSTALSTATLSANAIAALPPCAAQASILAGFAFDSLVELEIPNNVYERRPFVVSLYYIAASSTMALSLYTVCVSSFATVYGHRPAWLGLGSRLASYVSSFATVYGHRLALQGPTGSVDRAVAVMMKQRGGIFVTFGVAMVCLVVAAIAMV
jgi:hypothetical protein